MFFFFSSFFFGHCPDKLAIDSPFGGIKESGYGKEGGRQGTDEYTITKFVAVGTSLHNMPK